MIPTRHESARTLNNALKPSTVELLEMQSIYSIEVEDRFVYKKIAAFIRNRINQLAVNTFVTNV